jgi:hypothetical protein
MMSVGKIWPMTASSSCAQPPKARSDAASNIASLRDMGDSQPRETIRLRSNVPADWLTKAEQLYFLRTFKEILTQAALIWGIH